MHSLPMVRKRSALRRWIGPAIFALALAVAWGWLYLLTITLRPAALWSGLALLGIVLLLTVFNARKKLPFLPLLKASSWMRFHTYAGWFAVPLFLLHIHFRLPRGGLEITLALLFMAVTLSRIFGLIISRLLPPRLTRHGEEVLYERIPALQRNLRNQVDQLIILSVAQTNSSTLADYYTSRLKPFFDRPQALWRRLGGSHQPRHARLAGLQMLDRFLNDKERAIAARLAEHIRAKENLDFHYACQGLLKGWLFIHIPLAYSLILLGLVHGFLAWSFTSAAR